MRCVKTAPEVLIKAYTEGVINNGRGHLYRLLTMGVMSNAWQLLEPKAGVDPQAHWLRVWTAIAFAKHQSGLSKRRARRGDLRDQYAAVAGAAERLAQRIEGGPLDVLAFNLLPDDVLDALGVPDFLQLSLIERSAVAGRLLRVWPSAAELLRGLARVAEGQAAEEMQRPRADDRATGDVAKRVFVATLTEEFRHIFGAPKPPAIETIAGVVLQWEAKAG
jgi:hypothetical protein